MPGIGLMALLADTITKFVTITTLKAPFEYPLPLNADQEEEKSTVHRDEIQVSQVINRENIYFHGTTVLTSTVRSPFAPR